MQPSADEDKKHYGIPVAKSSTGQIKRIGQCLGIIQNATKMGFAAKQGDMTRYALPYICPGEPPPHEGIRPRSDRVCRHVVQFHRMENSLASLHGPGNDVYPVVPTGT